MAWHGMVWFRFCFVWYGMVWFGLVRMRAFSRGDFDRRGCLGGVPMWLVSENDFAIRLLLEIPLRGLPFQMNLFEKI